MVRFDRAGRKQQILDAVAAMRGMVSTHRLAYLVHMTPSPHFRNLVYEMWHEGLLFVSVEKKRNGRQVFYWSVDPVPQQQQIPGIDA